MKKSYKTLLFLYLALIVSVNTSAQLARRSQSIILTDTIHSTILNAGRASSIFLPQSYEFDVEK